MKTTLPKLFFVFLLFAIYYLPASPAFAQGLVFSGRVVDQNGNPLIGAKFVVQDAQHNYLAEQTLTDGSFRVSLPKPGLYHYFVMATSQCPSCWTNLVSETIAFEKALTITIDLSAKPPGEKAPPPRLPEVFFEPVADGDWFIIRSKTYVGDEPLSEIPEEDLPQLAVDPRSSHEPEHYHALVRLTSLLAGTDREDEQTIEDYGVWERLRLPQEAKINPKDKFFELEGLALRTYFDCVGQTQGYSLVGLDKNLGQTFAVLADLSQRLAKVGPLETTQWTPDYQTKNAQCQKRAEGLEGERKASTAQGKVNFLSRTGFGGYFKAVQERKCYTDIFGIEYCWWETTFYLLVQPKILPDPLTATIPELSYTFSQKQKDKTSPLEKFGGGIFRIFFPPEMEKMGEIEGKLYRGEPIHGKGIQDYYSPNNWAAFLANSFEERGGPPAEDVPTDNYGLGGVRAAWDFVQRALTPLR